MTQTNAIPAATAELADKLDNAMRLTGMEPLTVPALTVLIGRYIAYEAGAADRINEGLNIAWAMMRAAAIEEGTKLYGPLAASDGADGEGLIT
jgi:hypothetical protein